MAKNKVTNILVIIIFITGVLSYIILPEKVPLQWNALGGVNRYGGKLEASTLMPIAAILLLIANKFKGREADTWKSNFMLIIFIVVQLVILGITYFIK